MKIELETPYKNDWRLGYIVTNPEQRRTVILFNSSKERSSVSYARYKMAVYLGRYLTKDEHVDHINNDKTQDNYENLQILSQKDNAIKQGRIMRKYIHGSLSCYRYCKCAKCKLGKRLYNQRNLDEYTKLIS
jgi:hypothetical protein